MYVELSRRYNQIQVIDNGLNGRTGSGTVVELVFTAGPPPAFCSLYGKGCQSSYVTSHRI